MKFKLYFEPIIIEARDGDELERRIDDWKFMSIIIKDVEEIK